MPTQRTALQTAACAAMILLLADGPARASATGAIGVALTEGSFQVNHASVWGNATIFDGSLIETGRAASQVRLSNGAQVRLAAETRATIFEDRVVLEKGQGEMAPSYRYEVEAGGVRIRGTSSDALMRIRIDGSRRVLVASMRGALKVSNRAGIVVAQLGMGDALEFEATEKTASATTQASGCLLAKNGGFILVDRTTNVILELQGVDLRANLGNRVDIMGTADRTVPKVADTPQLVTVASAKMVAVGGCAEVAKKVGATTAVAGVATSTASAAGGAGPAGATGAAGAAAAGIGAGTVAVIGGVAAAATVGGLAVVGRLPGQSSVPPTASR